jgi:putative lipoic acid-binding regulatory protein
MKEDFFAGLQQKLDDQCEWPHVYMFKFIIPADNQKLALVEGLFGEETVITTRQSSSNKFISITAKELMLNSDEIINIYKEAAKIEGIMSF